ncbi:MAG: FapA family protein, partial [Oscillospiraceae bacterium]|nr:FapA family protein [Oscillospiraceae bacterium]
MDNLSAHTASNGKPIDGEVRVDVDEDFMAAYITVSGPLYGGREVTVSDALEAVEKSPVAIEFEREAVIGLINGKEYNKRLCIAKGKNPDNGLNGTVSYRFDRFRALSPQENEKGVIDYKDLGLVHNIVAGTIIAEITHETEGEDGYDIRGGVLKATCGQKAKYALGKCTIANEDETQIIAEKDGNLVWQKDRFTVEDTVVIKEDVGASTGNIDFIGDVVVKGNVMENFVVVSKRNVTIGGNITNAKIIADGNVEVKTGSVNSSISAKGNVKIGFCENSKIECGGDLSSASFVACDIFCNGVVSATSGKGVVVGGRMTSLKG